MTPRHATPEELGMAAEAVVVHGDPADDSDFEITVVDDTPPEDQDRPKPAPGQEPTGDMSEEELATLGSRAQKRIKRLKWEFHEERRAKETSERTASEAVEYGKRLTAENEKLRGVLGKTQAALNDQALKRADAALRAAEDSFKVAHADGDADRIAESQKAMTNALMAKNYAPSVAKRVVHDYVREHDKVRADAGPEVGTSAPEGQGAPQVPATPPPPDPQTQAWMDANPWFKQGPDYDRVMASTALGIHEQLVMDEGIYPETTEYYSRLDSEIRKIFPNKFEAQAVSAQEDTGVEIVVGQASQPAPVVRQVDTVVAPATRNNGARAPQKIVLTETQVALAKRMGVPLQEYAKQVIAMERANV